VDDNLITATGCCVRSTTKESPDCGRMRSTLTWAGTPAAAAALKRPPGMNANSARCSEPANIRSTPTKLNWRGAYAQSTRDAPYERFVRYIRTPLFPFIYDAGANAG